MPQGARLIIPAKKLINSAFEFSLWVPWPNRGTPTERVRRRFCQSIGAATRP